MSETHLTTPITEEDVRQLNVGDTIYISGTIVTARDEAHKRALEYVEEGKELPVNLEGGVIFHCGPIMKKSNDEWEVVAAGPTTSTRMEIFEAEIIEKLRVRVIIGKGGMEEKTTDAMKKYDAVYAAFTGGAAVLAAKGVKKVISEEWKDLGMPEALWVLETENFGPLTVAIDSHGNNLFSQVDKRVKENVSKVYKLLNIA